VSKYLTHNKLSIPNLLLLLVFLADLWCNCYKDVHKSKIKTIEEPENINPPIQYSPSDDVSASHNFNRKHFTNTFAYLPAVNLNDIQHLAESLKLAALRHFIVCNIQIICFRSLIFDELTK